MAKNIVQQELIPAPKRHRKLLYYEPKKVPLLDDSGHVIGYQSPRAYALSLSDSDGIREKPWPNEKGMSADPNDVAGFRALVDLINQNRNLQGNPLIFLGGCDDASALVAIRDAQQKLKSLDSNEPK